jgi:hypothetical protein
VLSNSSGLLALAISSMSSIVCPYGNVLLMSIDNSRERKAASLPQQRRFIQQVIVLREQDAAQFQRTVQQFVIVESGGTVLLRSQYVHAHGGVNLW